MAVIVTRAGAAIHSPNSSATANDGSPTSRCRDTSKSSTSYPSPRTGKVQKFVLRERGITVKTWDRDAAGVTIRR